MNKVEEDLKYARNVIFNNKKHKFSTLYPFTTENLCGYIDKFDFKDKRVLTVGSSADQIFKSFINGSKDIVCFDINPLVKYYFNLKVAAIKSLSLEEFTNFFCFYNNTKFIKNRNVFNLKDFEKLTSNLDDETLYFWTSLYNNFKPFKIRKELFEKDEYPLYILKNLNGYLNRSQYNFLKNNIDQINVKFITSDIKYVTDYLDSKFDYILLSNIAAFIEKIYSNQLQGFKENIISLSEFLKKDGIIFLCYLYEKDLYTKDKLYDPIIYHLNLIFNEFRKHNINIISFDSVNSFFDGDFYIQDSVLTYKK